MLQIAGYSEDEYGRITSVNILRNSLNVKRVPVVHCYECRYHIGGGCSALSDFAASDNFFCAFERRK